MERKTDESNTDTADYENEKVGQTLPNDLDAFDEFVRIITDQPQPEVVVNPTPVSTLNSMPDSYSSPYYRYGYRYNNELGSSPSGHAAGGSAWNSYSCHSSIHSPTQTGLAGTSSSPLLGSEQPYHYQMFNFGESTPMNPATASEPSTPVPRELIESVRVMSLSNPETTQLLHKREGARGHIRKGKGKLKMHEMDSDDKRFRNAKVAKANRDEKKREIEELRRENEMLAQANTELEIDWFRRREIIRQLEEKLADVKNREKNE